MLTFYRSSIGLCCHPITVESLLHMAKRTDCKKVVGIAIYEEMGHFYCKAISTYSTVRRNLGVGCLWGRLWGRLWDFVLLISIAKIKRNHGERRTDVPSLHADAGPHVRSRCSRIHRFSIYEFSHFLYAR